MNGRQALRVVLVVSIVAFLSGVAAAGPLGYVVIAGNCLSTCFQYTTTFGSVDLNTGAITQIGATDGFVPSVGGLAWAGGGLYANDAFLNKVYLVDPATGSSTLKGTANVGTGNQSLLASSLNSLYILALPSMNLYSFNPANGTTALVGPTGLPAMAPDFSNLFFITMAGLGDKLYVDYLQADNSQNPVLPDGLYRINPTTGQSTLVGGLSGAECVTGLGAIGNSLYAAGFNTGSCQDPSGAGFFRVDPTTAVATFLSTPSNDPIQALAGAVPEPGSFTAADLCSYCSHVVGLRNLLLHGSLIRGAVPGVIRTPRILRRSQSIRLSSGRLRCDFSTAA